VFSGLLYYIRNFECGKGTMNAYDQQAELFKALAHPVRLQILDILRDGEHCVCHIEAVLGLRQAYISQQLTTLRQAGWVIDRKDGLRVYYRIADHAAVRLLDQTRGVLKRRGVTCMLPENTPQGCPCPRCSPT
jgi:ArsR family transcriptional regulator